MREGGGRGALERQRAGAGRSSRSETRTKRYPRAFARGTAAARAARVAAWGWPMAIAAPRWRAMASMRSNCSRIICGRWSPSEEDLALGRRHAELGGDAVADALRAGPRVEEEEVAVGEQAEDGVHRPRVGREARAHVVVGPDGPRHRRERRRGRRPELAGVHAMAQRPRPRVLPVDRLHRQVAEDLVAVPAQDRHHLRRRRLEGEHRVGERDAEALQGLDLVDAPAEVVDHHRDADAVDRRRRRGPRAVVRRGSRPVIRRRRRGRGAGIGLRARGRPCRARRSHPGRAAAVRGGAPRGGRASRRGFAALLGRRRAAPVVRIPPAEIEESRGADDGAAEEEDQAGEWGTSAGGPAAGHQAAFLAVSPSFPRSRLTPRSRMRSSIGTSFSRKVRARSSTTVSGFKASRSGFLSGPV